MAHNCHIKTKCSHQIQITHIKFKSLTANSNYSQQIKTTHSTFKLLTANNKSTTANYKSFTSNQIVHIKYKSLTANTNTVSVKGRLRTADCRLRTRGKSRLRVKCRLQTKGKIQSEYRRLGVKCRIKTADQGENERKDSRKNVCARRSLQKSISGQNVCIFFLCSDVKICLLIEK